MSAPEVTAAVLREIRDRAEGATAGPWRADQCGGGTRDDGSVLCPGGHANGVWSNGVGWDVLRDESDLSSPDAEFIAHARTDVPRLVDALEAVVGLHSPRKVICLNPLHDKDCDAEVCDTCDTPWPCPTVRAITEALTTKEAL